MTVVLLICATMLGQTQPAQLPAKLLAQRTQQEMAMQAASQPYRLAQLKLLVQTNLSSVLQLAAHSYQQQLEDSQPQPHLEVLADRVQGIFPKFLPATVLLLRGP